MTQGGLQGPGRVAVRLMLDQNAAEGVHAGSSAHSLEDGACRLRDLLVRGSPQALGEWRCLL
eukprot:3394669-Pyramimonas_sp.AAC.1